jgi:hypothetical protein
MVISNKLNTHCQVCGGLTADLGDIDHREGYIEVKISWGPNSFDGVINEEDAGILGYAVYVVSDCGEKQGSALATIRALGVSAGGCCDKTTYEATVLTETYGIPAMAFMVVPLTSIGALDLGWVTPLVGDWVNATNNKKNKASAQDQANQMMASASTADPQPVATSQASTVASTGPVVKLSMILNIDYAQLSADTKTTLKSGIQTMLATVAMVDDDKVSVTLTPGSTKVEAEIQTTGANTARALVTSMKQITAEEVSKALDKIPEVKEAIEGELTITGLEVTMDETSSTVNQPEATGGGAGGGGGSSVAMESPTTTRAKQASTSAGDLPGPRLELLLLLLPLLAV